jgi:hypothetical protein
MLVHALRRLSIIIGIAALKAPVTFAGRRCQRSRPSDRRQHRGWTECAMQCNSWNCCICTKECSRGLRPKSASCAGRQCFYGRRGWTVTRASERCATCFFALQHLIYGTSRMSVSLLQSFQMSQTNCLGSRCLNSACLQCRHVRSVRPASLLCT